jgi:hypothetical protein
MTCFALKLPLRAFALSWGKSIHPSLKPSSIRMRG